MTWTCCKKRWTTRRQADVLLIDGSALAEFPVPNLMKAYQGHKLVLFNTAPLVFDSRAGLVVPGTHLHRRLPAAPAGPMSKSSNHPTTK